MKVARVFPVALLTGYALTACGRPKPPTITPESADITSIGPDGVHLMLHLGVENPNRFDLSARSVAGRVLLDGKHAVGTVAVSQPVRLPSGQVTHLSVPTALALRELPAVMGLMLANRNVTYDVDGSVNVGGESLNVNLPFHLSGVLTPQQLLEATVNSLPTVR